MILTKRGGNAKTLKGKDRDKNKNNRLMSLHIDDDKLLEKYKTILVKNEDLKQYWIRDFSSLWW